MNRNYVTISTALVLMLTGVVGAAEAKTQHVHCKGSGTFGDGVETHLDTNGDGTSAIFGQGLENCNTGRFLLHEEVEWVSRPTVTTCPTGTSLELYLDPPQGKPRTVLTDEKTGDQLFFKATSGLLCVNLSTEPFTFADWGQFEYIGGTGKYAGATGTGEFYTTGSYLAIGFKDGILGSFGQYNFTSDSTMILPKDNED